MLCQLVCIDRRYQRMNCFNIRELQGILKRRFFTDLVNSSDFHKLLDSSMVGLRFKTGNQNSITPNSVLFYNYGLSTDLYTKSTLFNFNYRANTSEVSNLPINSSLFKLISSFSDCPNTKLLPNLLFIQNDLMALLRGLLTLLTFNYYPYTLNSIKGILNSLTTTLYINLISTLPYMNHNNVNLSLGKEVVTSNTAENFTSDLVTGAVQVDPSSNHSDTPNFRFTRFNNALIQYDYKCGNYIGIWDKLYPSLINSYIEVARGVRKPS